jgi:hypothetical protein
VKRLKLQKLKMKKVLVTFVLLMAANLVHSEASAPAIALVEFVKNFYLNQSLTFDFLVYKSTRFNKILSIAEAPARIEIIHSFEKQHLIEQSAILIFNDTKQYLEFYKSMMISTASTQELYLLVYIENLKPNDLNKITPQHQLSTRSYHENYLIDLKGKDVIELVTFTTFQQPNCREFHPLTINQFSKLTRKWETQKFSTDRFNNFNGCKLLIGGVMDNLIFEQIHRIVASNLNFQSVEYGAKKSKE